MLAAAIYIFSNRDSRSLISNAAVPGLCSPLGPAPAPLGRLHTGTAFAEEDAARTARRRPAFAYFPAKIQHAYQLSDSALQPAAGLHAAPIWMAQWYSFERFRRFTGHADDAQLTIRARPGRYCRAVTFRAMTRYDIRDKDGAYARREAAVGWSLPRCHFLAPCQEKHVGRFTTILIRSSRYAYV